MTKPMHSWSPWFLKRVERALRWADKFLLSRIIPVTSFGWVKLGVAYDDLGVPNRFGRWGTTATERAPFYAHNQRLMMTAARLRAIAFRVGGY